MDKKIEQINKHVENISLQTCMLEEGDIPAMGTILNSLAALEKNANYFNCLVLSNVIEGLQKYVGQLVLNEESDVKPLEEGVMALTAIWRDTSRGKEFSFDITEILVDLGFTSDDASQLPEETKNEIDTDKIVENEIENKKVELSDEDVQILGDFTIEARENLETIELKLIELEHQPDDKEIINAIFRPFHTIKGVSGFLKLEKINIFCHHIENLIDSARVGSLIIDDIITDIILESVDTLNLMMDDVEKNMEIGVNATFDDIDTNRLIEKIKGVESVDNDKKEPIGKVLVDKGAINRNDLRDCLKIQKNNPENMLGEILVKEKKVEPAAISSAMKIQKNLNRSSNLQVKVDTEKLDNLVDLTGELVIAQSMFKQIGLDVAKDNQKYFQQLNQVNQVVSSLQHIAMSMRMVPIKNTFQKMFRLVRDLSRNSAKEVDLTMSGEDTEIDRNVVEELYEPMVHMIRNSIDHGLETPMDRESMGKSLKGSIHLGAYQKGGNIIIEIKDDGKGLDKTLILEKAIERKLVSEDDNLSDKEIYSFIMHPGFSTAKEVTDISGRGVGMDVVKKGIEKLRGRLDIDSEAGKGTLFTISLPLTMAIVEGMLVRVEKEKYIIPTHTILESFRPDKENCFTVENKCEMIRHRENLIPLVRIGHLFNATKSQTNPWEGIVAVVENDREKKALLLDELLGKEEFVIKSLGETFKNIKGLAGSAILSDGKVGLILDMSGLFEVAVQN